MTVANIMSKRPVMVGLDDTLSMVKEIFDHAHFHHLLAVENGELLGIVSDRDLFKALSPNIGTSTESYKDAATLNKRVHQIMTRRPMVLRENATISEAATLLVKHGFSCIPIVGDNNRPVGVLTWRDILKHSVIGT